MSAGTAYVIATILGSVAAALLIGALIGIRIRNRQLNPDDDFRGDQWPDE